MYFQGAPSQLESAAMKSWSRRCQRFVRDVLRRPVICFSGSSTAIYVQVKLLIPRDNMNNPIFPSEHYFAVVTSVLSIISLWSCFLHWCCSSCCLLSTFLWWDFPCFHKVFCFFPKATASFMFRITVPSWLLWRPCDSC